MKQIQILLNVIVLSFTIGGCSIYGKFSANVSPPYSDYTFRFGKFKHFLNGDVYGEYGEGNYKIQRDTLILEFNELAHDENTVKVNILANDENNKLFTFKILNKEDMLSLPGASVVFFDNKNSIIKNASANIDGELEVKVDKEINVDRIIISYIGFEPIEISREFGSMNKIYIEWQSSWLRIISDKRYSASTLKILTEQEMVISESKDEFQEYKELLEIHLVDKILNLQK
jgi:hypothetical protein